MCDNNKPKLNVTQPSDSIVEHGYTGIVSEERFDDILGSVMVSIWNKLVLSLKEFKEGMGIYGLGSILSHSQAACKPLFVKGHIAAIDANYQAVLLYPQYYPDGSLRRLVKMKVSLEDDNITGYYAESVEL